MVSMKRMAGMLSLVGFLLASTVYGDDECTKFIGVLENSSSLEQYMENSDIHNFTGFSHCLPEKNISTKLASTLNDFFLSITHRLVRTMN